MPLILGLAGGTGSGKTTIAKKIKNFFAEDESVAIIEMDSYYKDFSELEKSEREKINYDHPHSIDFDLLKEHMQALAEGKAIEKPIYDFVNHTRKDETETVNPSDIVVLEGILTFFDSDLRDMFSIKIFVDTDADIRVLRRIRRDIEVRGRTFDSVRKQYYETVRPMHNQFVEPGKQWADVVIPEGGNNCVAIDMIVSKIRQWIADNN